MKRAWLGLTVIAALLAAAAPAWSWNSISVPGDIYDADTWTPSKRMLATHSGTVWSGDIAVDHNGGFKFAANGNWTVSWGGTGVSPVILRLPATGVGPLTSNNGQNISLQALDSARTLHFAFDDTNLTFNLSGPAAPAVTSAQLVGAFNSYGATDAGTLVNTPGSSLWTGDIELTSGSGLSLLVNGTETWGPPTALAPSVPCRIPLCGDNSFPLADFRPGTFRATFDASDLTLDLKQIATNTFVRAGIAAEGPLNALWAVRTNTLSSQDINLAPDGSLHSGSFWLDSPNTRFTLSFSERDAGGNRGGLYWSFPSAASHTISATPYTNTLVAVTNASSVVSNTFIAQLAGFYQISFNPASGALSVQRRYTASDGVNLFDDPSFEKNGSWFFYNARRYSDAGIGTDDEPPSIHTGKGVAALLQRRTEEGDYGSVSQEIVVSNYVGATLRVSAWMCSFNSWSANKTRIWIQWRDAAGQAVGTENDTVISSIPATWTPFSFEAEIPEGAVKANVLFNYNGANGGGGSLLIDDAEACISSTRHLDFDSWEKNSFAPYSYAEWKISSGRTTNNLSDAHLDPGSLFISKYIEGSNNNKAIELYNPTGDDIDLKKEGWKLQQYNNGATSPSATFALSNTVKAGECFLITRPSDEDPEDVRLDPVLEAVSDFRTNGLTFNGDDAIVLLKGTTVMDRVGPAGNFTGTLLNYVMRDHTLARSPYTSRGTTDDAGFPYGEWEMRPCDDFTELKSHVRSLPPDLYLPSGNSLVFAASAILTSPRLDGGIGDVSFWYRTAYPESAGISNTCSATLVVEASDTADFSSAKELGRVEIPADQYDFKQFSVLADLADYSYFRIRSTNVTGGAYARIDDLSVGVTLPISRYQDFNVWTNADWAKYVGRYSLGGWTLAAGHTTLEGGISVTPAAVLPNGASVTSPELDTGAGLVYFWTSAEDAENDSYAVSVEQSPDGGVTWKSIGSFNGTGVSNWVSRTLSASAPSNTVLRFVSTGAGPVVLDNIRIELPEETSRNQDFNTWPVSSGYTSESFQGWVSSSAMIAADSGVDGTKGYRSKASGAYILSPALEGGLGIFSFSARPYSASHSPGFKVEISTNGATSWKTVYTNRLNGSSSVEWVPVEVSVNNEAVTHVRIVSTMAQTLCLDSIVCGKIVPPPSMSVTAALEPAIPYPLEPYRFVSYINPVGGATMADIDTNKVTVGYTLVKAGQKPEHGVANLVYDGQSGIWTSGDFPGLADGSRIVFSNNVTWTSNDTEIVTSSSIQTVYVSALANSGVWINEVFSICNSEYDGGWGFDPQDHEFVELCGPAGTDLDGWSLELHFSRALDIANNGGKSCYATYLFSPSNTLPPSSLVLSNQANGYGFFVVGDSNTNWPVNVVFDQLVPDSVASSGSPDDPPPLNNHLNDSSGSGGVIILKNKQGVPVHSVSYNIPVAGTTAIGTQDSTWATVNSISAIGEGSSGLSYTDRNSWSSSSGNTAGGINNDQTLVSPPSSNKEFPESVFHHPPEHVQPAIADAFDMLDPWQPTVRDSVGFHLGFSTNYLVKGDFNGIAYVNVRKAGTGDDYEPHYMEFPEGYAVSTNAYLRWIEQNNTVPYIHSRLETIEYYFEFDPDGATGTDYSTAYVGVDGEGNSHAYKDKYDAMENPFVYTFPFDDIWFISLAEFKANLKNAEREDEYPFDDTVEFPSWTNVAKLVFFDPDFTDPPAASAFAVEALSGSLVDTDAWDEVELPFGTSIGQIDPPISGDGTYYFVEFERPDSPAFFRIVPATP